ncbi:MAG: hypothetical protein ABJX32_19885 [Tateyamaria sp.]|uniref:hypothetical protein n=1 Tax=Tateyamaria sp. TaxID=1929288 RepID=UPI00329E2B58
MISVTFKHMPFSAAQTVVVDERTDKAAHDFAGCARTQSFLVTVIGELQQMTTFHFFKHLWPSEPAWETRAQKMVNIWPKGRTMETVYA